ncbi:MAG: phosphoadenosine phosphosulfate reductase family protein [Pseudomonadota bacterium]
MSHDDASRLPEMAPTVTTNEAVDFVPGNEDAGLAANRWLSALSAPERVLWSIKHLPGPALMTSSFGIESAVLLHMVREAAASRGIEIPVVLIDSGYLHADTYRFADQLEQSWDLPLHIYHSPMTSARQEAQFGKLWTQGDAGARTYQEINRLEPLRRAFRELGGRLWLQGGRIAHSARDDLQEQSEAGPGLLTIASEVSQDERHVSDLPVDADDSIQDTRKKPIWKLRPLFDWSDEQISEYANAHELPRHPLADRGHDWVGDVHSIQRTASGF